MEAALPNDPMVDPVEDALQVPCVTLDRDWATFAEARCLSKATAGRWLPALRSFEKHLGRSDLFTLTPEDIKSWVLSLLDGGMSKKTVMGVDLPAITMFIAWASSENLIDKAAF